MFRIEPATPGAYYMPGADPGEGYMATNDQLYGSDKGPASAGQAAAIRHFPALQSALLGPGRRNLTARNLADAYDCRRSGRRG